MIPFTDTYSVFYSIFTALGEGEKTTRFVFSYYFYRLKFRENLVIQNLKLNFFFSFQITIFPLYTNIIIDSPYFAHIFQVIIILFKYSTVILLLYVL